MTTVVVDTDTTVVFAGIPAPVTVCPAPIKGLVAAKVMVVLRLTVVAESVNTPTRVMVEPVADPARTGVSTLLSMRDRFWPGWAKIRLSPAPPTS